MIFVILIKALFMLHLKGTSEQEIKFDPQEFTSPCSQGLRSDVDKIKFRGTIGKDFTSLVVKGWKMSIEIQMATAQSPEVFVKMCDVAFGASGSNCGKETTSFCFCDRFKTAAGEAHFVVNYTVTQNHSEGMIRGHWANADPTKFVDTSMALPRFYVISDLVCLSTDANKANLTLKVNSVYARQTSEPFGVEFLAQNNNTIELCCIDSAMPCYPTMTMNGVRFTSKTNCVSHSFVPPDMNFKANMTFAYSICNESGNLTGGSGVIATVEEVPDEGSSNDTDRGNSMDVTTIHSSGAEKAVAEGDGCPVFFCILSIMFSIVFLGALTSVIGLVIWVKRSKRTAEVEEKREAETPDFETPISKSASIIMVEDDKIPDKEVAETVEDVKSEISTSDTDENSLDEPNE